MKFNTEKEMINKICHRAVSSDHCYCIGKRCMACEYSDGKYYCNDLK